MRAKIPRTYEEAIAHLVRVGMYRRPLVRMVREALEIIGQEYIRGKR